MFLRCILYIHNVHERAKITKKIVTKKSRFHFQFKRSKRFFL